jgi:hypothetical protein
MKTSRILRRRQDNFQPLHRLFDLKQSYSTFNLTSSGPPIILSRVEGIVVL